MKFCRIRRKLQKCAASMHDMHDQGLCIIWTLSLLSLPPLLNTYSPCYISANTGFTLLLLVLTCRYAQLILSLLKSGWNHFELILNSWSSAYLLDFWSISRLSGSEKPELLLLRGEGLAQRYQFHSLSSAMIHTFALFKWYLTSTTVQDLGEAVTFVGRGNTLCSRLYLLAPSKPRWWDDWQSCSLVCSYHWNIISALLHSYLGETWTIDFAVLELPTYIWRHSWGFIIIVVLSHLW